MPCPIIEIDQETLLSRIIHGAGFTRGLSNVIIGHPAVVIIGHGDGGVDNESLPLVISSHKTSSTTKFLATLCRFASDSDNSVLNKTDNLSFNGGSASGSRAGQANSSSDSQSRQLWPSRANLQSQVHQAQQRLYSTMDASVAMECWFLHVHQISRVSRLGALCTEDVFIGRGILLGQSLFVGSLGRFPLLSRSPESRVKARRVQNELPKDMQKSWSE